jgi:hypothetical protein
MVVGGVRDAIGISCQVTNAIVSHAPNAATGLIGLAWSLKLTMPKRKSAQDAAWSSGKPICATEYVWIAPQPAV